MCTGSPSRPRPTGSGRSIWSAYSARLRSSPVARSTGLAGVGGDPDLGIDPGDGDARGAHLLRRHDAELGDPVRVGLVLRALVDRLGLGHDPVGAHLARLRARSVRTTTRSSSCRNWSSSTHHAELGGAGVLGPEDAPDVLVGHDALGSDDRRAQRAIDEAGVAHPVAELTLERADRHEVLRRPRVEVRLGGDQRQERRRRGRRSRRRRRAAGAPRPRTARCRSTSGRRRRTREPHVPGVAPVVGDREQGRALADPERRDDRAALRRQVGHPVALDRADDLLRRQLVQRPVGEDERVGRRRARRDGPRPPASASAGRGRARRRPGRGS